MKNFDCFKNVDIKGKIIDSSSASKYPGVFRAELFNDEELLDSGMEMIDFFAVRFNRIDELVIQPWVKECLDKLKR